MTSQSQRFCGELAEQGLYLERLLVLEGAKGRDPQPLTSFKSAPPDALKCAAVLEAAARGATVSGRYVLYLMTVQRRVQDNAGLAVASAFSKALRKPLLVVEAMSGNAPWSSARVHTFIGESAAATAVHFPGYLFVPQGHDPLVEPEKNVSARIASHLKPEEAFTTGLLSSAEKVANASLVPSLFDEASLVVCDWAPFYIFPDIALRAQRTLEKRNPQAAFVCVDDVGLVPLFKHPKAEAAARFIRPKLQAYIGAAERERVGLEKMISERLVFSERLPLSGELLLGDVVGQTQFDAREYAQAMCSFARVSDSVPAVKNVLGGASAALQQLERFLQRDLGRYGEERNHPNESCSSKLSPWLHFGMIHPRTVLARVSHSMGVQQALELQVESSAAKFVDELVTWRELGQNMAHFAYRNGVSLGSPALIPGWAWETLKKFVPPPAKQVSLEKLEAAESPDPVWNAAQKELLKTGVIHNYMRMLWGKGIVRWSNGPEEALQRLEYLNNKYSLDGRDPNSYTGIYWCLGKFDRPWPPAREPFGIVRSMSTAAAQKKLRMDKYLKTW
ncbi:MAG: hypothetical protein FJY29_10885 [Betaproteobacteria bacterium]|nr:hypothetical protein [Betaproteobacteria bacterium]